MLTHKIFRAHFEIKDLDTRSRVLSLLCEASQEASHFLPSIANATGEDMADLDREKTKIISRLLSDPSRFDSTIVEWFADHGIRI